MIQVLCTLCDIYVLAIFGRIIFSWIPIAGDSPVAIVRSFLVRVTEPLMGLCVEPYHHYGWEVLALTFPR